MERPSLLDESSRIPKVSEFDPGRLGKCFDYHKAFSRTRGWLTGSEQDRLRAKRIAIAGMGGVGGSHLLTLSRLGIGAFHIADFDSFELANFNRQVGATLSHLGRPKTDVLAEMALDINPELEIRKFPQGVQHDNLSAFLDGIDLYVDGLDFFALSARQAVFAACAQRGIPAVTVAPLGMSAALVTFLPGRMTFEEYFRLEGLPLREQILNFLVGLAPAMTHRAYLADPSAVDLDNRRAPSTPMACELCAGVAATEAVKILLGRGKVYPAPHAFQYDAFRQVRAHTWRPGGNRNPLQRLTLWTVKRLLQRARDGANA